jgi:VanZ family protein
MSVVISRWLPVLVWAGVIFAFSSIPSLGTGLGTWDYVLRKLAHTTEYAILAVLLARATGSYAWAFALTVAYAGTDEFHQTFVRGRHGSPIDVAIDAAGALAGLVVRRFGPVRRPS